MLAVHFGAGNIGRGFIGQVLNNNGYRICFVDVNPTIVQALNEQKGYDIHLAQEEGETIPIHNVYGLHSEHDRDEVVQTIARADLITVSVGVKVLPLIAPILAEGLQMRTETHSEGVHVIACENAVGASTTLKKAVQEQVGDESKWAAMAAITAFPDAAVDRIVPSQTHDNALDVTVEPFYEWVIQHQGMIKEENLSGVKYVHTLTPYIERKLFTVNTGHACLAYMGFVYGKPSIAEAINDPYIQELLRGVFQETGQLLHQKYAFEASDLEDYHDQILGRFSNIHLSDPVERVGRNPLRKLRPSDRLLNPLVQLYERGIDAPSLINVTAAAFLFDVEEDEESVQLQQRLSQQGVSQTVQQVTQLEEQHPLVKAIEAQILNFQNR